MSTTITLVSHAPGIVTGKKYLSYRTYVEGKAVYFFFKRVIDITGSMLMIGLVFTWLFPLVALLLKLDSRGPVFFLQKRVGKGGRSFTCYKFRTMFVNEEAHEKQAAKNDSRITRIGYLLRQSNIDELPQFFNVLLGQMSIVGPRPHMYADCHQFGSMIPRYKLRNLIRPGITGMAQVNGYHGPATDYDAICKRYQWDIFYLRNASAWVDLKIMTRTVVQHLRLLVPRR
ncbi:sugar transferase [Pseudoflavitalea sp. X16]|uniref:sugar transferase n=1 Tax=Paraflavitalea devenefica TaxID=2716334 RepID=UPI00141F2DE7|nr:sugar transferase [Paraflavitalea devenefica]NII27261.1 sugar transferase [Paraflavitalea devenefica]